ncbi:MAG: hypothetical protein A3J51_03175 [Omnitrophica WOR_2 bacterium RIFCSPHIGHO2_02_FULL_45_21]|nr:MAG: hypothetical protein A3J51_03175 [Omnitrophica WOR_2 bacterium RIFCSPHIGHO2_02_FULL_45_21]
MRRFGLLLFIIFIFVVFLYVFLDKTTQRPAFTHASFKPKAEESPVAKEEKPIERIGEKIVYGVILKKISLGRAVFTHLPHTQINGKKVSLMTFETKLIRFSDLETIYSDTNSFLPLKVERDISSWPIHEKITEHYDQENFILTIRKDKGREKRQVVIRKNSPIHNAIMLPFYVRRQDKLNLGWSMIANLPSQQFEINLVSIEELKVPAGTFKAYRFKSNPDRFEIWLSADERKIPLKIKGAGTLGYTLVMKEYSM